MMGTAVVVQQRYGGAVVVMGKCLGGGMVVQSGGVRYDESRDGEMVVRRKEMKG